MIVVRQINIFILINCHFSLLIRNSIGVSHKLVDWVENSRILSLVRWNHFQSTTSHRYLTGRFLLIFLKHFQVWISTFNRSLCYSEQTLTKTFFHVMLNSTSKVQLSVKLGRTTLRHIKHIIKIKQIYWDNHMMILLFSHK